MTGGRSISFELPPLVAAGRREQEPQWWVDAATSVLELCLAAPGVNRAEVAAIPCSATTTDRCGLLKSRIAIRKKTTHMTTSTIGPIFGSNW